MDINLCTISASHTHPLSHSQMCSLQTWNCRKFYCDNALLRTEAANDLFLLTFFCPIAENDISTFYLFLLALLFCIISLSKLLHCHELQLTWKISSSLFQPGLWLIRDCLADDHPLNSGVDCNNLQALNQKKLYSNIIYYFEQSPKDFCKKFIKYTFLLRPRM